MSYVYFIGDGIGPVKIGRSTNPHKRLAHMQTGNPNVLRIEALVQPMHTDSYIYELAMHNALSDRRVRGEWFEREAAQPIIDAVNVALADGDELTREAIINLLRIASRSGGAL